MQRAQVRLAVTLLSLLLSYYTSLAAHCDFVRALRLVPLPLPDSVPRPRTRATATAASPSSAASAWSTRAKSVRPLSPRPLCAGMLSSSQLSVSHLRLSHLPHTVLPGISMSTNPKWVPPETGSGIFQAGTTLCRHSRFVPLLSPYRFPLSSFLSQTSPLRLWPDFTRHVDWMMPLALPHAAHRSGHEDSLRLPSVPQQDLCLVR